MTLVLSVHSRDSLWLVVDRRLSYADRRPPRDDAVKVMCLEATDGVGLLAYAGLGATLRGTQPSKWMSTVLRGHWGLTFEQALGVLSAAANKQLPKYLTQVGEHVILIPAFIHGVGARLYSIDNVLDPKTKKQLSRYTSHQCTDLPGSPSLRLAGTGTGSVYLHQKDGAWRRELRSLVKAHDHGKVSDHVITDQLAKLNHEAHRAVPDTVGPDCIVVWRRRRDARRCATGGGHQFYKGVERDRDSAAIPTIANGMDVISIAGVLSKHAQQSMARDPSLTPSNVDPAELARLLAQLPSAPDEKLR